MYESEKWSPTGIPGLQHRSYRTFLYRRRICGRLHRIYIGRVHQFDAELIAELLQNEQPEKWPRIAECTKEFMAWDGWYI